MSSLTPLHQMFPSDFISRLLWPHKQSTFEHLLP